MSRAEESALAEAIKCGAFGLAWLVVWLVYLFGTGAQ